RCAMPLASTATVECTCRPQVVSSLTTTGCENASGAVPLAPDATDANTLLPFFTPPSHTAHKCEPSAVTALAEGLIAPELGIVTSGSNQGAPLLRSQRIAWRPPGADRVTKTSPVCRAIAICAKLWKPWPVCTARPALQVTPPSFETIMFSCAPPSTE